MEQVVENHELIKKFLLGQLPVGEEAVVEEKVFTDQESFRELLLVEGELIDSYVFGILSNDDQTRMRTHFLVPSERLEDLRITRAIERYVSEVWSDMTANSAYEETLREAQQNRAMLESLISNDWMGLRLLAFLRPSSRTQVELAKDFEDSARIESTLERLVTAGLVDDVGSHFTCTKFGLETLRRIEDSYQIRLIF